MFVFWGFYQWFVWFQAWLIVLSLVLLMSCHLIQLWWKYIRELKKKSVTIIEKEIITRFWKDNFLYWNIFILNLNWKIIFFIWSNINLCFVCTSNWNFSCLLSIDNLNTFSQNLMVRFCALTYIIFIFRQINVYSYRHSSLIAQHHCYYIFSKNIFEWIVSIQWV